MALPAPLVLTLEIYSTETALEQYLEEPCNEKMHQDTGAEYKFVSNSPESHRHSHCLFSAPPLSFFNTGIDSTHSPICWHPSVCLITQPGMKQTIQEKMGFRQYEVTKALEHISCICSRNSSGTSTTAPASHTWETQVPKCSEECCSNLQNPGHLNTRMN